jgi:hypothetical protein
METVKPEKYQTLVMGLNPATHIDSGVWELI